MENDAILSLSRSTKWQVALAALPPYRYPVRLGALLSGQRPDSYQPRATPWVHRTIVILLQADGLLHKVPDGFGRLSSNQPTLCLNHLVKSFSTSSSAPRTAAPGLTLLSGRACTPIWPLCVVIVIAQPTALGAPPITSISQRGWLALLARPNSWKRSRRPPRPGLKPKVSNTAHFSGREVMAIFPSARSRWGGGGGVIRSRRNQQHTHHAHK